MGRKQGETYYAFSGVLAPIPVPIVPVALFPVTANVPVVVISKSCTYTQGISYRSLHFQAALLRPRDAQAYNRSCVIATRTEKKLVCREI